MKKKISQLIIALVLVCQAIELQATEPYQVIITVPPATARVTDPNLVDLSNDLKTTALELLIPFYTPVTPVSMNLNLRGLLADMSFAAGSTTLVVNIPQAGISTSFTADTRDNSLKLFREYISDGGDKHRLFHAYAKYSPIDPLAGNPNSLMAQMAQGDYLIGRLAPLSGCNCCWSAQPIVNLYQGGFSYGRAFSGGFDTTTVTLPFRYSYSPDLSWAFIMDAPLTYNRNGGASSLFGSLGIGLRVPLTCDWSLTPITRVGVGGSLDLCTAGCFVSTGLTSEYHYAVCDYVLSMTNYAGYVTSTNLVLSNINFNYNLHNYIFKNGLTLTSCNGFTFCERPVNFNISFVDSYFVKDRLYINHYDEIGASVIVNCVNPCFDYDSLSIGFAYQFGQKNYKGYYLNMVYQF